MKLTKVFVFGSLLLFSNSFTDVKYVTVNFAGGDWVFPLTVGEAVKRYGLSYKPPGYYYTEGKYADMSTVEYDYETDDFVNENQPERTLYSRTIHAYVHAYNWKPTLFDSLKNALQEQFGKKMLVTSEEQEFIFNGEKASLNSSSPVNDRNVYYGLIKIDSGIVIGLRHKPTLAKNSIKQVEVLLMYNRSDNDIRKRMMSF